MTNNSNNPVNFDVIIPARYASTRLLGKPLLDLGGMSLIERVYHAAKKSSAEQVIVATDDQRIVNVVQGFGGDVILTDPNHPSGTDRIAEVVTKKGIEDDRILVNVQGDEPFVPVELIEMVAANLATHQQAVMSTACHAIDNKDDVLDPNVVKVVADHQGYATYFSRSPIPYPRNEEFAQHFKHIGIYAYRAGFVAKYNQLEPSAVEKAESLEQLRVLSNGFKISLQTVDYDTGFGIDTEQDLQKARDYLASQG